MGADRATPESKTTLQPSPLKVYGLLFLLMLLAFGIYIPWLGLYGDDWQYLYVFHLLGAGEYPNFVAADRPFSAWVYQLFTPILGENVAGYHVLVLLIRWAGACVFYQVLKRVWPEQPPAILYAALFFAIFPGFKQQPLPLEFVLHFTVLLCFLISVLLMLAAVDAQTVWKKVLYLVIAVLLSASLFSVEYFVGLELIRPVLLWFALRKTGTPASNRLKSTLYYWLPFLLVLSSFAYWRVFIYKFQFYAPGWIESIRANPLKGIVALLWRSAQDVWLMAVGVLRQPFSLSSGYSDVLVSLLFLIVSAVIVWWLLTRLKIDNKSVSQTPENASSLTGFLITGMLTVLLAGLPFWLVDVPIQAGFPWDRPALAFMAGAAMLWAVALVTFIKTNKQIFIVSVLLALLLVYHYQNARTYISEWQRVKAGFQQLVWRAPEITPGTILLTDTLPYLYYGDNTLSPALNWVYAPDVHQREIPYRVFNLATRSDEVFANASRNQPVTHHYRSFQFEGNTDRLMIFTMREGACLRLIDQSNASSASLSSRLADYLHLSDLSLASGSTERQLPHVFGAALEKDWCYYFENAERAAAAGDPAGVIDWYQQAQTGGYTSSNPTEYLPYLNALLLEGNEADARVVLGQITDLGGKEALCDYLNREVDQPELTTAVGQLHQEAGCQE